MNVYVFVAHVYLPEPRRHHSTGVVVPVVIAFRFERCKDVGPILGLKLVWDSAVMVECNVKGHAVLLRPRHCRDRVNPRQDRPREGAKAVEKLSERFLPDAPCLYLAPRAR